MREHPTDERYLWIEQIPRRFNYRTLGRAERGMVLRYFECVSGYSRQTLNWPMAQYQATGKLRRRQRTVAGFQRYYFKTIFEQGGQAV